MWVEPGSLAPTIFELRWRQAVDRALNHWMQLLPITLVADPADAQVRIRRRRPPVVPGAGGRLRASHGRATLVLETVERGALTRVEPSVEVLLSPAQREAAIEATALHELGHAVVLWGHSDIATDAMAAVPGAQPVLELSSRDRATLRWLYGQSTGMGPFIDP
ncbi:MAG: peptidase [Cyanobium sp.]